MGYKVTRRKLIKTGSAAVAVGLSSPVAAKMRMRFAQPTSPTPPPTSGWNALRIGGGGLSPWIVTANDGKKVVSTDVGNGYVWDGSDWSALVTKTTLGDPGAIAGAFGDTGMWAGDICRTNSNYIYCVFANTDGSSNYPIFKSTDGGATLTKTSTSFYVSKQSLNNVYTNNGWTWRLSTTKLIVDPNNPDVVYCGTIAQSQNFNGIWRTLDGGATWNQVTDVPGPVKWAGCCGLAFDDSSGTVVGAGGLTVTKRIMLNSSGQGSWLSEDGGLTWTQVAADPTPSTSLSYTTTVNNCVMLIAVQLGGQNTVKSVTMGGGLTAVRRVNLTFNQYYNNALSYWYVKVPTAGTYSIVVAYDEGGLDSWGGTNANKVAVTAFPNMDLTSEATMFDGAPALPFGQDVNFGKTTTVTSTIVAFGNQYATTSPDTGFTIIKVDNSDAFYLEYKNSAAAGLYNSTALPIAFGSTQVLVDAIKQTSAAAPNGTVQYNTSGVASYTQPTSIYGGGFDASGTYFCINGPGGSNGFTGSVWRHKLGAGVNGFEVLNGFGTNTSGGGIQLPSIASGGFPTKGSFGAAIGVDQRVGHAGEIAIMQNCFVGFQTSNANVSNRNSIVWNGGTGLTPGKSPTFTGGDTPWLDPLQPSINCLVMDPSSGKWWQSNGLGAWRFNTFDLGVDTYSVDITYQSAGIEDMIAQDCLMPAGATHPVCIIEDRSAIRTRMPAYPQNGDQCLNTYQGNATQADFAWGTGYMAFLEFGGVSPIPRGGAWSNDYGVTWTQWATLPPNASQLGGNIAVGSYTNSTTANVVIAVGNQVHYTTDNGTTWTPSTGYTPEEFTHSQEQRHRCLAADRDNPGTFYLYGFTSRNVWKSTNNGATFSLMGGGGTGPIGYGNNGFRIECVPGYPGHLWITYIQQAASSYLYQSTNSGVSFSRVNTNVDTVSLLLFGKAQSGGYPTLGMLGSVSGDYGFHRSGDAGATWTKFGDITDLPGQNQMDFAVCGCGDWNTYGSFYFGFVSTSFAQFTL